MDRLLEKISVRGYKLTPKRIEMIRVLHAKGGHFTPEEVWGLLKRRFKKIGMPSVYRNLETLSECGVLVRIHQFDRQRHYAVCSHRKDKHHHHIVCTRCNKVEEVSECKVRAPKKVHGFRVLDHFLQFQGVCRDCKMKA